MSNKYTSTEIQFLKENYIKLGRRECARILNRPIFSVTSKCHRLKIKFNKSQIYEAQCKSNIKHKGEFTVNESWFTNHLNEYTAYLLGFIWADGYLSITHKKTGNISYRIIIGINFIDGIYINKLLKKTGKWSIVTRTPTIGLPITHFSCSNTILGKFLFDHDYKSKSTMSPDKILTHIPSHLHKYFILGYFDGDGCIYAPIKCNKFSVIFTSNIKQDWKFLINICKEVKCKYSIKKTFRKNINSKFSSFKIHGSRNCLLFSSYMYKDSINIGFKRKKNKFKYMIKTIKSNIKNKVNIWKNPSQEIISRLY